MKRFFSIILSLIFLLTISQDSHAQFWKRKSKRKSNATVTRENRLPAAVGSEDSSDTEHFFRRKKALPEFPPTEKKDVYRVDVLLPLNLSKAVINGKPVSRKAMPESTAHSIDFYEGILIAGDSMAHNNFKLKLYIHDITEPGNNVHFLIRLNKMRGTDLIIGLLQSQDIPDVANYARRNKINFLSALSPSDAGMKDNPYFVLVQPTLRTHVQKILEFADRKYKRNPKFLIYRDSSYADDAYNMVKEEFRKSKTFTELKCNSDADFEGFKSQFSTELVNVIYFTILDTRVAYSLLKKLSALGPEYRFEIFGMPSWKVIPDLNVQNAYPNLAIYYTTPFYYDTHSGRGVEFLKQYKAYEASEPGEFAFRGYELMYWMCNLLQEHGVIINDHFQDISSTLFTRYDIAPVWNEKNEFLYFENKKLHILRYENGSMSIPE